MKISVCIVTCNGSNFIERQIKSIVAQSRHPDEIVLLDDCSDDDSVKKARELFFGSDIKYNIVENKRRLGINNSFQKCMCYASGDIILISDQDDYWLPDRILNIENKFLENDSYELVLVNALIEKDNILTKEEINIYYPYTSSLIKNFIKNSFTGCQMAIKKTLLDITLPFPEDKISYYDHWISSFALLREKTAYISVPQGYYCRHSSNVTDMSRSRLIRKIIISRLKMLSAFVKHIYWTKGTC